MTEEKLETLPELVKQHPSTYQVLARLRIQLGVKALSKRQTKPKTAFPFDRMNKPRTTKSFPYLMSCF